MLKTLKFKFTGQSALIVHSARGSNPLDPAAIAHSALTSKRTKTEQDHRQIAESEWHLGLYYDKELGPFLPSANIMAAVHAGAKQHKNGAPFGRSTLILEEKIPLQYDGPRDAAKLFKKPVHVHVCSVGVNGRRVTRCRPIFPSWSVEFEMHYDPTVLDEKDIVLAAVTAGRYCGIGDNRPSSPKRPGPYGRFDVEVLNG